MFTENFEDPNIFKCNVGDTLTNVHPIYANGGKYSVGHKFTVIRIEDDRYTLKDAESDRIFSKRFMFDFKQVR